PRANDNFAAAGSSEYGGPAVVVAASERVVPLTATPAPVSKSGPPQVTASSAYSARKLPLIPVETCHRFQAKVATDSDCKLPLMPVDPCHPSRGIGAPDDADITPSVSCTFLNYRGRSRCQHRGYRCAKSVKSYGSNGPVV